MNLEFPVEKIVKLRYSVRTYDTKPLEVDIMNKINAYMEALSNPFSIPVSFRLIETQGQMDGEKLGTYGVIKGANYYIGATVEKGELALEALGYSFEKLILYITFLGLGTCWLGGTFQRGKFASAMDVKENELFPAISPLGYPLGKKRLSESVARKLVKADKRLDWNKLFFRNDFSHPCTEVEAGEFAYPLKMLQLAPSAANKQPWRIVLDNGQYHFYKVKGNSDRLALDIQKVDIGIAACHFHLAALEKGLSGEFKKLAIPKIEMPEHVEYIFSFVNN
ncbi:MAG: nitroreductase family protein [Velocimicrobium sp.]